MAVAGSWLTLGMPSVQLPPSLQDTGVGVGIGDDSRQAILTQWVTLRQTLGPLVGPTSPQVTQQGLLRLCPTQGLVWRQSDETEWTLLRAGPIWS